MADQNVPQQAARPDGQHDTNVLSWPTANDGQSVQGVADPSGGPYYPPAGASADASWAQQLGPGHAGFGAEPFPGDSGQPGDAPGWAPAGAAANPDAAYWESKFRRQRMWTRFLVATIAAAALLFVGGGLFAWNVLLPRATDSLSQQLGDALPGLGLPNPGGAQPAPGSPDGPLGDDSASAPQDLSNVPLPDPLKGLGASLGIDNVEELLDTAVSMGLIDEEQADQIRDAVAGGGSLDDLFGSGSPDSGQS